MLEQVKNRVGELLASGKIAGFVGLRRQHGQTGPHLFGKPEELGDLVAGDGADRYPLNKLLLRLAKRYPDDSFGVLVRGCDERGLKTLFALNQLDPEKVVPVGIVCPSELAEACECPHPWPDEWEGEKAGSVSRKSVSLVDSLETRERFAYWMDHFSRCVKCYGCRDVCPMCFCRDCSLQDNELIRIGGLPPEYPVFHLVRAVHMAGRCVNCGLCGEACPADIPLGTLYKKVADIVEKEFGIRPGQGDKTESIWKPERNSDGL